MEHTERQPVPLELGARKKKKLPLRKRLRPILPFVLMGAVWQVAAMQAKGNLGALFPSLDAIAFRAWELTFGPLVTALRGGEVHGVASFFHYLGSADLWWHTLATAWRLPFAFLIAAVLGVIIGILMGRYAFWESFFVPLISVLLPIPALAWVPIAVVWFGLGDRTVIIVTAFATFLPIASAVWAGVKTVNPVWIRAAQSMNANQTTIFRTVVLPGSLPLILSGLRIGMARAWRAGVGAEAFAGIKWGLSAGIFDAQEFLDIAFMMVALVTLGLFGYLLEKLLFQPIESRTVVRWGMMEAIGTQEEKV